MKGIARQTFDLLDADDSLSLESITQAFRRIHSIRDKPEDWRDKLKTLRWNYEENIRAYSQKVMCLVKKSFPQTEKTLLESLNIEYFIKGLPTILGAKIEARKPKTLAYAINKTEYEIQLDKLHKNDKMLTQNTTPITEVSNNNTTIQSIQDSLDTVNSKLDLLTTKLTSNEETKQNEPHKNDFNKRFKQINDRINKVTESINAFNDQRKEKQTVVHSNYNQRPPKIRDDRPFFKLQNKRELTNEREKKWGGQNLECYFVRKRETPTTSVFMLQISINNAFKIV